MNEQNTREEDSDSRESSLSGDSNLEHNHHHHDHHPHQQHVRVLGEPLSDRSSSQSDQSGAGHRPRALIDAESRQEIDEYQAEDDSLQYFEEQERQIAMQMAQENIGGNGQKTAATAEEDGQNQHLAEEEETEIWREMMSRIEEEEDDENSAEDKKEVEDKEEKEEEMEEEEEGEKGRERSITEKEEEGEMEEEKEGEMEEEKEGKNNGRLSANSRISNGQEIPLRSSYSRISESLQNREFPGADLLSHPEEFDGQQKSNSAQPSIEGYPIGYPTEPPPAYSSPRKERPGTASSGTILRGSVRFPVPSPYEMTLTGAEHKVRDTDDHSGAEGTSATSNIRSAIVGSLTLAGGMATAVLATPSGDDPPKRSPFTSPRGIGHGVDSPRGDGQRQSAARVVQGARTVAELQQRHKTAQERHEKGGEKAETNGAQTQQQNKKEELDVDTLPHFPISAELKALFGQIEEYVAERVEIVPNWKPFQIDYIPAVGEVDPFIKVPKPDENDELLLGLAVLDEPATQQSDSAIVDLRLHQMAGNSAADAPVKKLSRADKNAHQIDRWIQNVKELRRTKAPTRVVYGKPMPSIESLMQEWPSEVEEKLKDMKLLINANLDADLEDFVDLCLGLVDIPVHKSRLEALHVLFSLYAEFRASQHFRNMALDDDGTEGAGRATSTNIDQFVVPD